MIFKQYQQVLDGSKTQTRRPIRPREQYWGPPDYYVEMCDYNEYPPRRRKKWQVGKTYAIQPGRGKRGIGRIRITRIRRERLLEIKPTDCIKEGIVAHLVLFDHEYYREGSEFAFSTPRSAFRHLWNSLHRKPYRWEDNPEVWVLGFEKVKE